MEEYVPPVVAAPPPPPPARRAPPSVPVPSKTASFSQQASPVNSVPAWKAELDARKAGVIPNSGAASSPVPAARRGAPTPGQKPFVPAKPAVPAKPMIPSRPGGGGSVGAPKPAPRAPPRAGADPSNAAASLADAVS